MRGIIPAESATTIEDLLLFLPRVTIEQARALVVGCALDDGENPEAVPIGELDADGRVVRLADGRRVLLGRVRAGLVIDGRPGDPLGAAVRAAWSPAEAREPEERRELGRAGVGATKLGGAEAARAVLALLRSLAAGRFPGDPERRVFYLALSAGQDRELARVGARVLAEFRSRRVVANMRVPDDLYWQLARFLRPPAGFGRRSPCRTCCMKVR